MCQALLEIMEPEINKIVAKAVQKETAKACKQAARANEKTVSVLLQFGNFSVEEIHQHVPELSVSEIEAIREKRRVCQVNPHAPLAWHHHE